MKNKLPAQFALVIFLLVTSCSRKTEVPANEHVVRCKVIGGMTTTGLWPEIGFIREVCT
jgi:hypothetical protein